MQGTDTTMTEEQAADFAALSAAADAAPLPPGVEPPPPPPDPAAEMAAVIRTVTTMLSPLLPYLPAIYTEETCAGIAAAYMPVADKYGWQTGGWFEQFGAELALVAVAAPVAISTAQAHRAWAAERAERSRRLEQKRDADAAAHFEITRGLGKTVEAGTVAIGEPVPA